MGRIAARLVRVPIVVNTTHGFYASPDDPWARRVSVLALERFAARFSDLELYQSEEDLEWARRSRVISPSRSLLLGNGVNIREFDPSRVSAQERTAVRRELGIPDDAVLVGTVARLVLEKGYRELFAAAARIHASLPEVRFIAVGPQDPDKSDAIGRDELDRAAPDVIFTGHRRDILPLLAAMDIFVLPSWREGVPRSAIEAAAMGKPLVLTNIRGCREVARHGIDGLLVPPRDSRRLARAIEQLIRDPELRKRMGAAARTRVEERFDERTVIDLIVAQYRSLLARHGFAEPLGDHATPPVPGSMSR
jgi:glycosyltransferase involved in cell wall biosynthesis